MRKGAQHLHRRVDRVLAEPAQARNHGEDHAEGRADDEPEKHALH